MQCWPVKNKREKKRGDEGSKRKRGMKGIEGWWRRRKVWTMSPAALVCFIFSVQGPGTAAWWDFQPCGLRCPSIHLEGCRVRSGEPATRRHGHREQPGGQAAPLIWASQLCSFRRTGWAANLPVRDTENSPSCCGLRGTGDTLGGAAHFPPLTHSKLCWIRKGKKTSLTAELC